MYLIIDNHDSFTFNLYQLISMRTSLAVQVVRNDEISAAGVEALKPRAIVISPGPGRPGRKRDLGVCSEIIASPPAPVLGVCLGHQAIAWQYGASIEEATPPTHGLASVITHSGTGLFAGIPQRIEVVRYHSLQVSRQLTGPLIAHAWLEDGTIMAVAHASLPLWGVQYHPESVATEAGSLLVDNFLRMVGDEPTARTVVSSPQVPRVSSQPSARVYVRAIEAPSAEAAFVTLFEGERAAFWLDSSDASFEAGRFSYIGSAAGPHGFIAQAQTAEPPAVTLSHSDGRSETRRGSFLEVAHAIWLERQAPCEVAVPFSCGLVGYLGYELFRETLSLDAPTASTPDASLAFVDRMLAIDHDAGRGYLLCWSLDAESAELWLEQASRALEGLGPLPAPGTAPLELTTRLSRPPDEYLRDIERCQAAIAAGETYEACLTCRLEIEPAIPLETAFLAYRHLRRASPAPFGGFLDMGGAFLAASSPEQFLRLEERGRVVTRPIKGTRSRALDPKEDQLLATELSVSRKDRAENLMIVDLLRNDLGRVCEVGSVAVPSLMHVESFAQVHQLVSTVTGQLRRDVSPAQLIRSCFPGGSMTGAPKERTVEFLRDLEAAPRGVYSGAFGYWSCGGEVQLAMVIRTLVLEPRRSSVGIGGAITALSDKYLELKEIVDKSGGVRAALASLTGETGKAYIPEQLAQSEAVSENPMHQSSQRVLSRTH